MIGPAVPFDTNVRGDVEPLDFVPQLVSELQDLRPQIYVFNGTCRVTPLVSTPPLCPAQHTIDHKSESGQMRDLWPFWCPCRLRSAACNSPRLLVWSSLTGILFAVSLWSRKNTPYPSPHPTSGCISADPSG